jgi:hypothetical protein
VVSNLRSHGVVTGINISSQPGLPQSFEHGGCIGHVTIRDRDDRHLLGSTPGRKSTCEVLDQHTDESLDRAIQRAMKHHRLLAGAVRVDVLQTEAFREVEVNLDGAQLPVAPDRVPNVYVDLGAIESSVPLIDLELETCFGQRLRDSGFGQFPQLVRADRLLWAGRESDSIR